MAISPVNQYQMTVQTVASQLENEEISTNEKFSLVARTVLAGANIVRVVHEDNQFLKEEKKVSDRKIVDLEEKNEVSDRRIVDLEEKNKKLEENNSSLEENVKKLSCTTHEEYKDNCKYRAEIRIKSLTSQVSMAKTGKIGLWTLGVVTIPILVGSGLVVAAELGVQPEIEKMKKEIWVLENFPESTRDRAIQEKAKSLINTFCQRIKDLDFEASTYHDPDSSDWTKSNQPLIDKINYKKSVAIANLEAGVQSLKNEIQEKIYS